MTDEIQQTEEQARHDSIFTSLILFIQHCRVNFSRAGDDAFNNFAVHVTDEIIQAACAIRVLAMEGILDTSKRELRYLIELAAKACLVAQKYPSPRETSLDEQITDQKTTLGKTDLNLLNAVTIRDLDSQTSEQFVSEVKRLYGVLSQYAHASYRNLTERRARARAGRPIGKEGESDLADLNDLVVRAYSVVIVLLSQALPEWVIGDFMVSMRSTDHQWYFVRSRYISSIDAKFDYKAERQEALGELASRRSAEIEF